MCEIQINLIRKLKGNFPTVQVLYFIIININCYYLLEKLSDKTQQISFDFIKSLKLKVNDFNTSRISYYSIITLTE